MNTFPAIFSIQKILLRVTMISKFVKTNDKESQQSISNKITENIIFWFNGSFN